MNTKSFHIKYLLAYLAVAGLFVSMVHYHSEGLECLEHAEEAHIIPTVDFCPICTIVVSSDIETPFNTNGLLTPSTTLVYENDVYSDDNTYRLASPRAPPFLA
ncbi:hypothetical protein [Balneola vulgaris]|uniref:hypothetical protein n=1 Tax=Balneola vulgaris TaxID=287535 RepID=UPI000362A871|nr:hypothetical protein [Balneola vulgaris]